MKTDGITALCYRINQKLNLIDSLNQDERYALWDLKSNIEARITDETRLQSKQLKSWGQPIKRYHCMNCVSQYTVMRTDPESTKCQKCGWETDFYETLKYTEGL